MTPRLVPYSTLRHLVPAMLSGALGLTAWWVAMLILQWRRDSSPESLLAPDTEASIYFLIVASFVAAGQVLLEGRFARTPMGGRIFGTAMAAGSAALFTFLGTMLLNFLARYFGDMPEGSLGLKWRLAPWLAAGAGATWGPWFVRAGRQILEWGRKKWNITFLRPAPPLENGFVLLTALHGVAGMAAGVTGALVWYLTGLALGDRYMAAALGAWALGALVGSLVTSMPSRHWVGWVRVRTGTRPGWRVPLDPHDPARSERFIGHFSRGMDVHLRASEGSAELHVSFVAKQDGDWAVRGLSQARVDVLRPLERVDLAYDASLPAPLETPLRDGDLVRLDGVAEVEFVVANEEGVP